MIEATKVSLRNVRFHSESWGRLGRQIALYLFVTLLCTKQEIPLMKFLPLKKTDQAGMQRVISFDSLLKAGLKQTVGQVNSKHS